MEITSNEMELVMANEAVAGLAVLDYAGDVYKYDLKISREKVAIILNSLLVARNSYFENGREVDGFFLHTEKYSLMVCFFEHFFFLIEPEKGCDLNALDGKMRSMFGSHLITV